MATEFFALQNTPLNKLYLTKADWNAVLIL